MIVDDGYTVDQVGLQKVYILFELQVYSYHLPSLVSIAVGHEFEIIAGSGISRVRFATNHSYPKSWQ